jgi:hypothetical protein
MRKWILNIHMYLALICSSYLIIYGISSLDYNHHWTKGEEVDESKSTQWEQAATIPPIPAAETPAKSKSQFANTLRDQLGLFGWTVPWSIKSEGQKENMRISFLVVERPGKRYAIEIPPEQNRVIVTTNPKSWLSIIRQLHAFRLIPNSKFVSTWLYYTELCNIAVLFAAVSGIYLWMLRRRERKMGLILLSFGVVFSMSLILYIWRVG